MKKLDTVLVVFGTGDDNKPHAARAKPSQTALATKAAELMGYSIATTRSSKAKAIARDLPEIQIYASGRALVPRVKAETYDQLLASVTLRHERSGAHPSDGELSASDQGEVLDGAIPNPWAAIKRGSIVLAEEAEWAGWYEALVVGLANSGRTLLLRWRDWPKQKQFAVARTAVAIPPSARPAVASPRSSAPPLIAEVSGAHSEPSSGQ